MVITYRVANSGGDLLVTPTGLGISSVAKEARVVLSAAYSNYDDYYARDEFNMRFGYTRDLEGFNGGLYYSNLIASAQNRVASEGYFRAKGGDSYYKVRKEWYGSSSPAVTEANLHGGVSISEVDRISLLQRYYSEEANSGGGTNFSLAGMYMHFQIGGGKPMYINASSIDFSGTNQRQLGLDKIGIGKTLDPVNLFNAGINSNSLAFGRLSMTRVSETQFSIAPNMFDFDYQSGASWQRNAGTILGGMINYNLFPGTPFSPLVPLIFGGPYNVIFNGTVTIPK